VRYLEHGKRPEGYRFPFSVHFETAKAAGSKVKSEQKPSTRGCLETAAKHDKAAQVMASALAVVPASTECGRKFHILGPTKQMEYTVLS